MELSDAVALVTGGGTGIGRATALLFAQRGAKVVICGRRLEPLEETARLIKLKGKDPMTVVTDVRDWIQVKDLVDTVLRRHQKVDILINNAGIAISKPVVETSEAEWDETIDTNLKGIFWCCKAVLPSMLTAGTGIIVNVSSILGKSGIANMGAYCASKFGVMGFSQTLADELRTQGIRVYVVCPGATDTSLHRRIVGEEMAKVSMPPEKIGRKIVDLVRGQILLPSGGALVIDDQSDSLAQPKAGWKWGHQIKQWLNSTLAFLRN